MKKTILTIMVLALAITSMAIFVACDKPEPNTDGTDTQTLKVKMIDIDLSEEEYAFGVAKGSELKDQINTAYEALVADGTIKTINDKYLKGVGTPTAVVSAAKDDSKDQLVVATELGFKPFEYKDGTKIYGIDMEVMAAIAAKLNKELVIVDMDFGAVVESVKSGQADVAAAALTVNEERKLVIDFTKPYYQSSQVVIVKGDDTKFDNCKNAEDVDAVIKALAKDTKAAFQIGTTGEGLVESYKNLKKAGYQKVGLAATDLINGQVSIIVVDKAPAKELVASVNK